MKRKVVRAHVVDAVARLIQRPLYRAFTAACDDALYCGRAHARLSPSVFRRTRHSVQWAVEAHCEHVYS